MKSPLLEVLAHEAAKSQGAARQTAHVAVLGYAANVSNDFVYHFVDAVDWLSARQYFVPGRPPSFEVDGIGLFGVAIGLRALGPLKAKSARDWLENLLQQTLKYRRPSDWNETLIRAALELLLEGPVGKSEGVFPDLRAALCGKGLAQTTAATRADAWDLISGLSSLDDMTRAAAQVAATAFLLRDTAAVRLGSTTLEDVGRLLSGVSRSMRRWAWDASPRTPRSRPARWDIENEYHVQDMLWSVIAPVFPDLDDEEWLKSLGHHHPRADLAIPSLKLIIEVKFLRKATPSALSDIIKEVAADASTYLREDSPFHQIIAFIWDDTATTEQHAELRQGLLSIKGVADTIILPRPKKMIR
ncbi:hypothetical protein [Labrys sp. 22185]|uniref:PD-(D/E)XK nuclease domain-containing protein n=1 Tax=Labrys sp. 22185 TaxID=3453888 RepID=UPI003F84C8A3